MNVPLAAEYPDTHATGQMLWGDGAQRTEHMHQPEVETAPATSPPARKKISWRNSKLRDEEYETGLVQRLNAVLEALAALDIVSQLERIAQLEQAGSLTAEEASALNDALIAG